jgi:choloylglycine hydrolase
MNRLFASVLVAALLEASAPARACTTFAFPANIVGKSYDFSFGDGLAIVNKRHVAKRALLFDERANAAEWVSRYGSLTFNQFGRELPMGGMNEKGLVVEVMWLRASDYGDDSDPRPALNELQWIQYLLDTAATVKEALAQAAKVRVKRAYAPVHYMACDRSGACATFEYLRGALVTRAGKAAPVPVLTNDTYDESLAYLEKHVGFGGTRPVPAGPDSLERFARAASMAKGYRGAKPVEHAFAILQSVYGVGFSRWNIVYETTAGRVHYRNAGEKEVRSLDFAAIDFSCRTPGKVLDLLGTVTGSKSPGLIPDEPVFHRTAQRIGLKAIGLVLPGKVRRRFERYPETGTACMEGAE